jgi:hypothetical protein
MRTRLIPILAMFAASPAVTSDQHVVSESKSPIVSDALDRGRQADVSGHSAAIPVLYQLSLQPIEQISPLVQRQYLSGVQSTFVKWTVKKGGVFPLYHHSNEQITWITEGRSRGSATRRHVASTDSQSTDPPFDREAHNLNGI